MLALAAVVLGDQVGQLAGNSRHFSLAVVVPVVVAAVVGQTQADMG